MSGASFPYALTQKAKLSASVVWGNSGYMNVDTGKGAFTQDSGARLELAHHWRIKV